MLENQEDVNAQIQQEVDNLKLDITLGQEARDLLENRMLRAWKKEGQAKLFDVLDEIPLNDAAARQRAVDLIYLFRKFERTMTEYVATGEFSKKRFDDMVGMKKKGLLGSIFGE